MAQSLFNLFCFSWANFISALGTTTLAICLSAGIAVLLYLRRLYITWRRERRKGTRIRHIFRNSLSWNDLIFYACIWIIVFGYFVIDTIKTDHRSLLNRLVELKGERDSYKKKIDASNEENKKQKDIIRELENQLKIHQAMPSTSKTAPKLDQPKVEVKIPPIIIPPPTVIYQEKPIQAPSVKEEIRDPDGIYQLGKLVAKVIMPHPPDLARGTIAFGAFQNAQDLNIENDFEYRDFILHLQTVDAMSKVTIAGNTTIRYSNVVCKITGRK